MHNDKENGYYKNESYFAASTSSTGRNKSDCMKCHSPFNWDPASVHNTITNFKGITCAICHNIHDMGESINRTGKSYAWFNRDAFLDGTRWIRNYTVMANTTELCGNCHSNDNPRVFRAGPGWNKTTDTTPISPHGWPAKDIFMGSFKQSGLLKYECIDCHMYKNVTNGTGDPLSDTEKIMDIASK